MTCRGGKEASERRSGIEKDERKSEMARLTAWQRHFDLVILVMLRKGNHLGEA